MKKNLKALILAASIALAGCGGGSGEDKNNENNPPSQNPPITENGDLYGRIMAHMF